MGMATRSVSVPTAAAAVGEPNAPNKTFANDRFIARLINNESRKPDAPSSAPDTMSTLFEMANPVAADASPEYELSRATTTGMSAPPIGSTRQMPARNASAMRL